MELLNCSFVYQMKNTFLLIVDTGHHPQDPIQDFMDEILADIHKCMGSDLTMFKILFRERMMDVWNGVLANNMGTLEEPKYVSKFIQLGMEDQYQAMGFYNKKIMTDTLK